MNILFTLKHCILRTIIFFLFGTIFNPKVNIFTLLNLVKLDNSDILQKPPLDQILK